MSKERLEEIKAQYHLLTRNSYDLGAWDEPFSWLIEQAERVQELEEENRKLNFEIGSYSLQVSEISQVIEREVQEMKKLSNRMVKGESE